MRNILIIFLLIVAINTIKGTEESKSFKFYDETAYILSAGDIKYSLFGKGEYGINEKLGIVVHPLMFLVSPSADLKYNFYKEGDLFISSFHGFNYPTLLLNLIKNKGTGGVISPEFDIPHTFSIRNGLLATYKLTDNHFISGALSFEFALNNGDLEPGTSVDLPVILPRTMVYYKNAGFDFKIISEGKLISDFDYHLKSDLYIFPFEDDEYDYEYQRTSNSIFWEFTGTGFWNITETFKLGVGGMLCYGTYPFGTQWHLIPYLDFVKYIE